MRKWRLISGFVLIAVIGAMVLTFLAAARLPNYLRDRSLATLRDRFDSEVEFGDFRVSVYPQIRISGEGLTLRHHGRTDIPPLIQIAKFSGSAGLMELLRRPSHLRNVHLDGLRIVIPPRRNNNQTRRLRKERKALAVVVDESIAENTELDILPKEPDKPLRIFAIHRLTLHDAGLGQPMAFHARLTNPQPRGEIETYGRFGPWQKEAPGLTPLVGTYTFTRADLAAFRGLAGILSSHGQFRGLLERIEVQGQTTTPDFKLSVSGHPLLLETQFHAIVDGTNGNTLLDPVRAEIASSSLVAQGGVFRTTGEEHRTVLLDVTAVEAKLEDLLRLAVKADNPPLTGLASFKTKLEIPPGRGDISHRLKLDGEFSIARARFTTLNLQQKVDELSRRGRGKPRDENVENVVSNLQGQFVLNHGVMTFPDLTFGVTGAFVHLSGHYALDSEELDFRGALRLKAKLSQTMTGWKSVLLKPVDPFFEKGGAGTVLPIKVTGTGTNPSFAVDLGRALRRKSE